MNDALGIYLVLSISVLLNDYKVDTATVWLWWDKIKELAMYYGDNKSLRSEVIPYKDNIEPMVMYDDIKDSILKYRKS